jgi:glycosyltransferase involved in cell wall biosynthesis
MARFLPETIESVLVNLRSGDEYFIIDGGSADGSIEIIRNYESYLTGWVSEPDNGYADAVAKGFGHCKGEFMCWINSGDLLLEGALQAASEVLTETGADLIFGDDLHVDEQSRVIRHSRGHVRSLKRMMLYGGWTPLQDACFWRWSLYEEVGGIDPNLEYAADYDLFLRASWAGRCVYVPKIFSAFRQHAGQKSVSKALDYQRERLSCRQRMMDQLAVPLSRRFVLGLYYGVLVRWRHHVARRFHRSAVPAGAVATALTVA